MSLKNMCAYLGHTTTLFGTAEEITYSISHFIKENNIDLSHLHVIGCDGTPVYKWWIGEVMRLVEDKVYKPLQHSVCLLHIR